MDQPSCYCGNPHFYQACCHPFLSGKLLPGTPEQLMRSRYTAFCTKNIDYLVATRYPSSRAFNERETLLRTVQETQWLGLKILKVQKDPDSNRMGYVEFAAFYKTHKRGQLHERSIFIRENGQWYYDKGSILAALTFGRNSPCWCGSNKKYKKCHGK